MGATVHVAQELVPRLGGETPQPIAVALGRVVRAAGSAERLDACIKAAEVIGRYVGVVALASAATGRTASASPPDVDGFVGNLSFGVFEKAARTASNVAWSHPLREGLRLCLKSAKKRKAVAGLHLEAFVKLRNDLGHAITHVDEARARALFERDDPVGMLIELLDGLEPVLNCPLLVVLGQDHRKGRLVASVSFFMGEGEPIPQQLELRDPVFEWETPYLCTPDGLIPVSPGLVYAPRAADGRLGLYLLDAIEEESLRYKSVGDAGIVSSSDGLQEIADWIALPFGGKANSPSSERPLLERIRCADGRSLHAYLSGTEPSAGANEAVEEAGGAEDEPGDEAKPGHMSIGSVREFEQRANALGLGGAYRDVVYFLAEVGTRAEISAGIVRVKTTDERPRVLATIELDEARPSLRVNLLLGSIGPDPSDLTEAHELGPGAVADALIGRIKTLMGALG
jgi:hypothetical protein